VPEDVALENYRDCMCAIRMIREAVETLGPPGILPSEKAVLRLYGPEAVHEAQAIVDALTKLFGDRAPERAMVGAAGLEPAPLSFEG
jgi:hypothetical protein